MYHTSNTAAARKRTRDNGASQRLPSPLRGTSLTPPSSTVSVMRHPEAQLELAEAIGAGDRATAPLAARRDPRGVRWPAPPAGQKKPAVPKPEGQCHWSRPGPKDVNAAISDDPAGRSKRSAATPTRLLRRFLLSRVGQVRWAHRSRNETVESEWPRCRTVESDAAANQRRSLRT